MKERERQTAGTLSGGGQEMLAVVKVIFTIIQTTNQQGITALLIEQNANMALKVPHKAYVIEKGRLKQLVKGAKLIGSGIEILNNIDMVGNNMALACGMCGSASGSIPTTVGQPAIRVQNITVGGQK